MYYDAGFVEAGASVSSVVIQAKSKKIPEKTVCF